MSTTSKANLWGSYFDIVTEPLAPGSSSELEFRVINSQPGAADSFDVEFYLSDNNWISKSDRLLATYTINGLLGNTDTATLTQNITLPDVSDSYWQEKVAENDTYYIGMIVDANDDVEETNEENYKQAKFYYYDDVVVTIPTPVVSPDLFGNYFEIVPEPLNAGSSFDIQYQIENNSAANAGGFNVEFYLSDNFWISVNDRLLGGDRLSGITGNNATGTLTKTLTLPDANDSFWDGNDTYYIGMIVDADNEVEPPENRGNNANRGKFSDYEDAEITVQLVTPDPPDLPSFEPVIELSELDGSNGFVLNGAEDDGSGFSVSSAGDINGDGLDDLLIGAPRAEPNGDWSGKSYVVFGKSSFPSTVELASSARSPTPNLTAKKNTVQIGVG